MGIEIMKMIRYLLLSLLFLFVPVFYTFAQEEPVSTASSDLTVKEDSTYVLPYPGMLPDNPLYFLKEFRDRFIGFLISDPMKKAEFDLLQADKRIASGVFLVNKKQNVELSLQTIEEGQILFKDAIEKVKSAKEQGVDTSAFEGKLLSAARKHEEVLLKLFEQTENTAFENHARTSQVFINEVSGLR